MSEKHLGEAEWRKFAEGRALKDGALLKSLGALDKAASPRDRLAALSEVDRQAAMLRKSAKGDRELLAYLDGLDKAVVREQAAAQAREEDEGSPALLTTRMRPLVRELRKGEVSMHALVTTAGRNTAVLVMRRPIAASLRKMMSEAVDAAGGARHRLADCLFEAGALTFVMRGPAAGLARRIREALQAQLDLHLKVRVRGEDGAAEEEGEDLPEDAQAGAGGSVEEPANGSANLDAASSRESAPSPASGPRQPFDDALLPLRERLDAALRAQHPQSGKLRAVEVRELRADARRAADAGPQLARLARLEATMHQRATALDFDGALATCDEVAAVRRLASRSARSRPEYEALRSEIQARLAALERHAMAPFGAAELQALGRRVRASLALCTSENGGWQKGQAELAMVRVEMTRVGRMLGDLVEVSRRGPAIRAKLAAEGVDAVQAAALADQALKLACAEGCSDDEAIAMARDAQHYVDSAGLDEPAALVSARVKAALQKDGVPADKARAVGRQVRCAGAADGEDAKAVARQVARMSTGVIAALNGAGTTTLACRGAITQAIPELCGEQPRGWPPTMTWDNVPGVYSPAGNRVVVGTMDAGPGGQRKVPGPGEGTVPHGTPDLVGHEAGHAFDVAAGGMRSQDPAFLRARTMDATDDPAATPPRARKMIPPGDNYFLTRAEGGANDAGATSETFAESFAMHFAGAARWPALEAFWQARPFGI